MNAPPWGVAVVALTASLAACNEETPFEVIEEVAFDPSLGIDLSAMTKLPEGVYIRDDTLGTGAFLAAGDTASLTHTGWLRDGTVVSQGQLEVVYLTTAPVDFPLVGDMIDGVEIGLGGMAVGGTRLMIVPPELGYGSNPTPPIPKGAILVFEFTLVSIR